MVLPNYKVYAVRYALVTRTRSKNFLLSDDGHGQMPIDYFLWLIVSEERRFLRKYIGFPMLGHVYSVKDVTDLVRRVYEQRVSEPGVGPR